MDNSIEAPDIVDEIGWTIVAVNRLFHGKFTCLMEAMAGKEMLRKRGISNALILGATLGNPTEPQTMLAHAWLRVGTKIVLGAEEVFKYKAIVSYCDLKES